jgi:hypothetical protein
VPSYWKYGIAEDFFKPIRRSRRVRFSMFLPLAVRYEHWLILARLMNMDASWKLPWIPDPIGFRGSITRPIFALAMPLESGRA